MNANYQLMKNKYVEFISENYRGVDGLMDLKYDDDIAEFIIILNDVKESNANIYKTCFEKIIEKINEKDLDFIVFMINNFMDFLDINDVNLQDDDFQTAILDVCNGESSSVSSCLHEFNINKNYTELYKKLYDSVEIQKGIAFRAPEITIGEKNNFYYTGPYDPINGDDYEEPIEQQEPTIKRRRVESALGSIQPNTTKRPRDESATVFNESNNTTKRQRDENRLGSMKPFNMGSTFFNMQENLHPNMFRQQTAAVYGGSRKNNKTIRNKKTNKRKITIKNKKLLRFKKTRKHKP
jgi:hypothetical protein